MQRQLPLLLGTLGLLSCASAKPFATATLASQPSGLTRPDSLHFRITLQRPAYYTVLAVTPGQPIQRLVPDSVAPLPQFVVGPNQLAIPTLPGSQPRDENGVVPRVGTSSGYLDEPTTSIRSPATPRVYWEAHPAATSAQPPTTILVVLFSTPLSPDALDQALPLRASLGSVAGTVRALGAALGLATTPPWLVLDPNGPRNAI
jgi:hypothetical protein